MYKKSDIKVGNYVRLGKKPFGDSRQTMDEFIASSIERMEELKKKPASQRQLTGHQINQNIKNWSKVKYVKVVGTRPLTYKMKGYDYWKTPFYVKWVTDVCENYKAVMAKGGTR
tara:strand:- start:19 stop:360 length:342 start_codon:yes stop_codon:yes gene_type:complete